jgi:hypothetical protein
MGADTPPHTLPYYSNVLSNIKEGRAIWIKIKAGIRTQMRSILGPSKRNLVEFHRISLTKPISSILGPSKRNLVEFHRISLTKPISSILGPSKRNLVEFHRISLTKPIFSILGPSKRNLVEFHRISLTKTANPNTASPPPPPLFLRLLKYNRRHPT